MTLSNPTTEEIAELFGEYHSLLQDLSAAYRRVNEMEKKMRSILGVTWEEQYETYCDEKKLVCPKWY